MIELKEFQCDPPAIRSTGCSCDARDIFSYMISSKVTEFDLLKIKKEKVQDTKLEKRFFETRAVLLASAPTSFNDSAVFFNLR